MTRQAAVATPHPAAASAAKEILLRGGNAIDAAVGAMLACCVATPGAVGLGGYGGSLVAWLAKGSKAIAIDFDSRAPLAYRRELFAGPEHYESGYLSITVPAVVAGLALAIDKFGVQSWAEVSQPAIRLAESGVTIDANLRGQLDNWWKKADGISRRAMLPGGVPEVGATWCQPDLAKLLKQLARGGPEAFYRGDIPQTIVSQVRAAGGVLSEDDFTRYEAAVVEPLTSDYRGYRLLTPPPPSGGLTTLQILKVLERFDLSKLQPWGGEYFHLFAETTKQCWHDRVKYFGDPDTADIPIERLLADEAAKEKAARIDEGSVSRDSAVPRPSLGDGARATPPQHTANIVVADGEGNLVSVTATQGYLYGSQVAIEGLGLIMGHGMSRFDLSERSPNGPAPGKRMFHNMAPMILLDSNNQRYAAVGLPGGPKIVTVSAQLVVSLIDFQATPAAAVSAPRIHIEADDPIAVSATMSDRVIEQLQALGHTVTRGQSVGGQPDEIGGKANAIAIDLATGAVTAASQAGNAAAATIGLSP